FWRDFRKWVKAVNPDAYLTGEIWWEDFPNNKMFDASPWLQGDIFDGVMNYRFGDAMLKGFVDKKMHANPTGLDQLLSDIRNKYPLPAQYQLMNIMGSHDNERFASMLNNPDRWIDHGGNLGYNKDFKVNRPSESDREVQKAILVFQFTYIGAPYIYYGDEVGMWGADDPDNRKPMVWSELKYEPETAHPLGMNRPVDLVAVDQELLKYYKSLIQLRKEHTSLRRGNYRTILINDQDGIIAFERSDGNETIYVVFNFSNKRIDNISSKINLNIAAKWRLIYKINADADFLNPNGALVFQQE
ncbi:MAG: alpha-amylase family glycosyl hydrolase, partial [Candidatus Neomarinimicrobiota bacterium]